MQGLLKRSLNAMGLLAAIVAQAQTIHVNGCAADPGDGSASKPFHELSRGVAAVATIPGSTLMIRWGSYTAVTFSGDAKNLTLMAEGGPVQIGLVDDIHLEAVEGLMARYDAGLGSWREQESGWWYIAPSALTTLVDYMIRTGNNCYAWVIEDIYNKNKGEDYSFRPGHEADFKNIYIDDSAWWGLAWVRAYDLTRKLEYLNAAKGVADWMWERGMENPINPADSTCGGGLWWQAIPRPAQMPAPTEEEKRKKEERKVKNAITNELFIELAASLHNRVPGDTVYLKRARTIWDWFRQSKMMPANPLAPDRPLIRDLLIDERDPTLKCDADPPRIVFSPPQGIILSGLVELYRATGDMNLLDEAGRIANAAIDSTRDVERVVYSGRSQDEGVLREDREEQFGCSNLFTTTCTTGDRTTFYRGPCLFKEDDPRFCVIVNTADDALNMSKGVFVRDLRRLYDQNLALGRPTYTWAAFLKRQRESLLAKARVGRADFGFFWTGPVTHVGFATQASAIDALNAAYGL
jgi:hypothetical protein